MDSNVSETRGIETLNLGKLLYSVEFRTKILITKLEKFIKKFVDIKLSVLPNQACSYEKLLPK